MKPASTLLVTSSTISSASASARMFAFLSKLCSSRWRYERSMLSVMLETVVSVGENLRQLQLHTLSLAWEHKTVGTKERRDGDFTGIIERVSDLTKFNIYDPSYVTCDMWLVDYCCFQKTWDSLTTPGITHEHGLRIYSNFMIFWVLVHPNIIQLRIWPRTWISRMARELPFLECATTLSRIRLTDLLEELVKFLCDS